MMSGQMGAGGMRYPAPGPYTPYPMQQHPISQMPTQPPQQTTQDSAPGYDGATSTTTSSTESAPSSATERPQPSSTATQNVQQHPYGIAGYYPSPGAHQSQAAMMHRATPHMGGGYPSHHNMPQQFPMPGTGAAPHYGAMYQPHMPQHTMPSAAHTTQPMHPNVYYNPMNEITQYAGSGTAKTRPVLFKWIDTDYHQLRFEFRTHYTKRNMRGFKIRLRCEIDQKL